MPRRFAGWAVAASVCALCACEVKQGSDGGTGPGPETTVELPSTASLDGWVRSDGVAGNVGPVTGDLDAAAVAAGKGYRQFYSFDLSSLPAGASVVQATLRLYQGEVGGAPYVDLGSVIVDHLNYGPSLEGIDYNATALTSNMGTISSDPTLGSKPLAATAQVQADRAAGRTRSQFRVRFSIADGNNNGLNDYVHFTDGENLSVNAPKLVVTYR